MKIKEKVYIKGRGIILILDIPDENLKINDNIVYNNKNYKITGIEGSRNLLNGSYLNMALLVREI